MKKLLSKRTLFLILAATPRILAAVDAHPTGVALLLAGAALMLAAMIVDRHPLLASDRCRIDEAGDRSK